MLDFDKIRGDFPILASRIHGVPLVYLDNAATTQVPSRVLDRLVRHYAQDNANIHRGHHRLSEVSSCNYELARARIATFIGAGKPSEVVFTSGTTASVNLVATAFARQFIRPGDEIVVSQLEHNSNFLPWQRLCADKGARLRVVPHDDGELRLEAYVEFLCEKTRIVAVTQTSNLTGTVNPVREMVELAHSRGIPVLIDGAQAIRHEPTDVGELGCDFYCFSGHKMLAPAGIGVLFMRDEWQRRLEPPFLGGGTVTDVTEDAVAYAAPPHAFEPGTPNYPGAIALAEAVDYMEDIGRREIADREAALLTAIESRVRRFSDATVLGNPARRGGVVSFAFDGVHSYDLASTLDKFGVAVRSGNHCSHIAIRGFPVNAAVRASPAFYNTFEEIERFGDALEKALGLLHKWKR